MHAVTAPSVILPKDRTACQLLVCDWSYRSRNSYCFVLCITQRCSWIANRVPVVRLLRSVLQYLDTVTLSVCTIKTVAIRLVLFDAHRLAVNGSSLRCAEAQGSKPKLVKIAFSYDAFPTARLRVQRVEITLLGDRSDESKKCTLLHAAIQLTWCVCVHCEYAHACQVGKCFSKIFII